MPRPQTRPQKAAARGSASDEALGRSGRRRKRRSRPHSSLLLVEDQVISPLRLMKSRSGSSRALGIEISGETAREV